MAVTVETLTNNGFGGMPSTGTVRLERGKTWERDGGHLDVMGEHGLLVASFAQGAWRSVKLDPAD